MAAFAMIWLGVFTVTGAGAGVRDDKPNLIGGELGGRGLVITLNYERFFGNHIGIGGGFMAVGASGGGVVVMPLYASVVPGDVHSLYMSVGSTLVGDGTVQDFQNTWLLNASIGYQFQSPGGFFVRPLFTYLVPIDPDATSNDYLIWPGLTIGGSF